jgi:hypothetical protein
VEKAMKFLIIIFAVLVVSCDKKSNEIKNSDFSYSKIDEIHTDSTNFFGESLKLKSVVPVSLTEAVDKKTYDTDIRLKGYVTNSCKKKGCWLILQDGNKTVRVTFKDYSFFVPIGFKEKQVVLEGQLKQEVVPESVRKHLAEDEGKSEEELEKISGDELEYSFVASSVLVVSK